MRIKKVKKGKSIWYEITEEAIHNLSEEIKEIKLDLKMIKEKLYGD